MMSTQIEMMSCCSCCCYCCLDALTLSKLYSCIYTHILWLESRCVCPPQVPVVWTRSVLRKCQEIGCSAAVLLIWMRTNQNKNGRGHTWNWCSRCWLLVARQIVLLSADRSRFVWFCVLYLLIAAVMFSVHCELGGLFGCWYVSVSLWTLGVLCLRAETAATVVVVDGGQQETQGKNERLKILYKYICTCKYI